MYFCKLVTLYLNVRDTLRNRTNPGVVVFWYYIASVVVITIRHRRSG